MELKGTVSGTAVIEDASKGLGRALVVVTGFATRRILLTDVLNVTPVTAETRSNLGGMVGGAAIGALLAGPIGAVVGACLSGGRSVQVALIGLSDGTTLVGQMAALEMAQLVEAVASAKRLKEADAADTQSFAAWAGGALSQPDPGADPWAFLK